MSDGEYVEQFKTIDDLREKIESLIQEHRKAKNAKLGVMFRIKVPPNSAMIYKDGHQGNYELIQGVRVGDYTFDSTREWVLADPEAGLSFSKSFSHLKGKHKLLKKHAKGYKKPGPADVAWWVLEKCPIPKDMGFKQDPDDKNHYYLAVTKKMHISKLIENLKFVSFRLNLARDISFD